MSTTTRYRQLIALAEHGSYRRAAMSLRISQPALSKAMRALETELGVALFDHRARGAVLTVYGERVLAHARQLVAAEDDLQHDLRSLSGIAGGRVTVALGPYPSLISGYAAAARLAGRHPQVGISLRVGNWRAVTAAVIARQVDLGIAETSDAATNDELQTEVLGRHRGHFLCRAGHPILGGPPATLPDLLAYPWATTRIPPRLANAFPPDLGRAGRIDEATGDLVPAIELDVPMRLDAFARHSDALSLSPLTQVQSALAVGGLKVVPQAAAPFHAEYGFIWLRRRSLSPAAQAYMQAVRDEERDFAAHEARLVARYAAEDNRAAA